MHSSTLSAAALFLLTVILIPPVTVAHGTGGHDTQTICPTDTASWRQQQTVANVTIQRDPSCAPDNPAVIAAAVKGTNNLPRSTLMKTGLAPDAIVKGADLDNDGDPDRINITLEVIGLNEGRNRSISHPIAPGITPAFWTFAPKTRGMATEGTAASSLIQMPAPTLRVEQHDEIHVTLENTHYIPHTIHFHGADHPYVDEQGLGNDGVPQTSERPLVPGDSRTYEFSPRTAGTMFYHCHVQPDTHVLMGLQGMFVIAENRSNNPVQTLNPGAGLVRHPSKAVNNFHAGEFDLHYQGVDKELHQIPQQSNDPRHVAKQMNREYDPTDRDPDYFLLNGKSYPYTLRDSLLPVQPNRTYRLRVLNGGSQTLSLHTHGHKFRVVSYDGAPLPEPAQYHRDVLGLTAAQRADIILNTTNTGFTSYGPGIWLMHDHREPAVTNDGMSPGGTVTMIVYESLLGKDGIPETRGVALDRLFNASFYEGKQPIWTNYAAPDLLGEPPLLNKRNWPFLTAVGLIAILLGGIVTWLVMRQ